MAHISLKVDVDTLQGTQLGVPRLLEIFERQGVRATFLFSLGPDHTGWALRRVFRPGFLSKVSRTSVVAHYGWKTLMYGVLLPAPDIGRRSASIMQAASEAGHECGIHTWDHVLWQDNVRTRDSAWTNRQMTLAYERFIEIFKHPPATHGAAGWQMNEAALLQLDKWALPFASDGRGATPYVPIVNGRRCTHVQIPTTLPTFDELIGTQGTSEKNVASALLAMTDSDKPQNFTLHAELEGRRLSSAFEQLIRGWKEQGHVLTSLGGFFQTLDRKRLPGLPIAWGNVSGRSGELMIDRRAAFD